MEPPPGGPPDFAPPLLLGTRPESLAVVPDFDGDVEFRFDETVSEGGRPNYGLGDGDLEKMILLSPSDSDDVPIVRWRRSRITVRPRNGWRPNRTYRVELQAGVNDLRNNRSRSSAMITFTTGSPAPTRELRGSVVDWTTTRPIPQALIEAILLPDTLIYRTLADSTGEFVFGPLPEGDYLVRGVIDQNRNRRRDSRESWDTVRVGTGVVEVGEVWAFRHDSVGPRVQNASRYDSLAIMVTFSQELLPAQNLPVDSVVVRRASDSTVIAVTLAVSPERYDSMYRQQPVAPPDSAVPDSAARAEPPNVTIRTPTPNALAPRTSRPPLGTKLVFRLVEPLEAGAVYLIDVAGVRNPNGASGGGRGVVDLSSPTTPAVPPDSTLIPPDTLAGPDTNRVTERVSPVDRKGIR